MQKLQTLLLIALALCLCLTACGQTATEIPAEAPAVSAPVEQPAEEPVEEPVPEIPSGPVSEGDPYRDFTATLSDGSTFTLSDHEGKVILMNFWATWCGYCVMEMPAFPRLVERYGDDLVVVSVNCGESAETIASFLENNEYPCPVVIDEAYEVCNLYPTDGIPYTVVIAPSGKIGHIMAGGADADTMYAYYSTIIDLMLA